MSLQELLKKIFLDSQLIGLTIGFLSSYIIYRLTRKDSNVLQEQIWKKEFDRHQTEPLVEIFKKILLVLNNNATAADVKSTIEQNVLNELKIEIQFIRYFDDAIRKKIQDGVYQKCLDYNDVIHRISSTPQLSGTEQKSSDKIANENRIEREKREEIEKAIIEVIDSIKSIYSKF